MHSLQLPQRQQGASNPTPLLLEGKGWGYDRLGEVCKACDVLLVPELAVWHEAKQEADMMYNVLHVRAALTVCHGTRSCATCLLLLKISKFGAFAAELLKRMRRRDGCVRRLRMLE